MPLADSPSVPTEPFFPKANSTEYLREEDVRVMRGFEGEIGIAEGWRFLVESIEVNYNGRHGGIVSGKTRQLYRSPPR
jgi:hypothetical protein